jgi:hypothetical protein
MREGLAREFPEAVRAFTWTRARMALFRRESVLWATVSAIGAGFLVSAVTRFIVGLGVDVLQALGVTTIPALAWPPAILGTAAAVVVALRAGGALSLTLYLVYLALDVALRIPAVITFCERSGFQSLTAPDMCTPFGFLAGQWSLWIGIGCGLLISRTIAARQPGTNRTLRVAGAYGLALWVVIQVWAATMAPSSDAASAMGASLTISVLTVAAAVVAGVVASLSEHRVRTAGTVAAILLLAWLSVQLPYLASQVDRLSPEFVPAFLVGNLSTPIAAIVLVLAAMVSDRQRFIPRDAP